MMKILLHMFVFIKVYCTVLLLLLSWIILLFMLYVFTIKSPQFYKTLPSFLDTLSLTLLQISSFYSLGSWRFLRELRLQLVLLSRSYSTTFFLISGKVQIFIEFFAFLLHFTLRFAGTVKPVNLHARLLQQSLVF